MNMQKLRAISTRYLRYTKSLCIPHGGDDDIGYSSSGRYH
jgi:hypothetical protein